MSEMQSIQSEAIPLTTAIHLGNIFTPGSNETISIVIPLTAAQMASLKGIPSQQLTLATVPNTTVPQFTIASVKCDEKIDLQVSSAKSDGQLPVVKAKKKRGKAKSIMEDESQGCTHPNCSRYGKAFSRAHDLKRHLARHEVKEVPKQHTYPCEICGDEYYNDSILQRHKLCHIKELDLNIPAIDILDDPLNMCHFCKLTFPDENQLNIHLAEHVKQITATICQVERPEEDLYKIDDSLQLTKDPATDPAPHNQSPEENNQSPGKIRCEYCSKIFKTKWTLSSHVAAHEGRFQYQCCICNKKFVRKSHYDSHVRSHDPARPYLCDHCGKTFKESKHKREHVKRKHPTNRNASIQSLLDSITSFVSDDSNTDNNDKTSTTHA